jgi:hypothetical protein
MVFVGCTDSANGTAPGAGAPANAAGENQATAAKPEEKNAHGEWWCPEHGMPEEVCAQCDSKLAAEFKKKGDWCEEHNRPDSQCFICHPEHKDRFAAQYRAKYGREPPPIEEESDHEHDDSKEGG